MLPIKTKTAMLLLAVVWAESHREILARQTGTFPASAPAPKIDPIPLMDRYGDPLPPRAVCRLGTLRLLHKDFVTAAAFSPDGKRFASTAIDGSLMVWEWPSGKKLHGFSFHTTIPTV
jgi:WD40 repeat protein